VIALVRHGETEANARRLLLGRADPSLSDIGRAQAMAVAERLSREDRPIGVVSSPLRRTRETATCIAGAFDLEVEDDVAMIEMDYGEWDERPITDVPSDVWRGWREDVEFAPPGGESLRAVQLRVSRCMERLAQRAADGTLIVVSHVSPIKAAALWALGIDERPELAWRLRLDLASITRVAPGPILLTFNERA
jgi:probable phosphoglycerate mutase